MQCSYDVAVIGGAIAGASTAFLLKRKDASLQLLIIEKAAVFDRKVGESTSEVGACFLALAGDAASFLDPLYRPGSDFISYTCFGIFEIIMDSLAGRDSASARESYIGAYFIGPVRQAYSNHPRKYSELPYDGPIGQLFGSLMRGYNRRRAQLAKRKMRAGTYGARNLDSRLFLPEFSPGPGSLIFMLRGLRKWMQAERSNLFLQRRRLVPAKL